MSGVINVLRKLNNIRWNIGFIDKELFFNNKYKINWLKHNYKDRWFADPFVLSESKETITLLVEEFYDKINRGRLAKLVVDKQSFKLTSNTTILELEEHLSFPFIFKSKGTIYVIPECYQSNKLDVYIFDSDFDNLIYYKTLLDGAFTDAIIYSNNGVSHNLITTMQPNPNGHHLYIYESEGFMGNYQLCQEVDFTTNIARGAGNFYKHNNKLYRPAQNCNARYGSGIVIQEVVNSEGFFKFLDTKYIYPNSFKYNLGLHTLNMSNEMVVVDGLGYRYPIIGRLIAFLKRFR